jgi:cell shape-determining protein MreD
MVCFKVIYQHMHWATKENHGKPSFLYLVLLIKYFRVSHVSHCKHRLFH